MPNLPPELLKALAGCRNLPTAPGMMLQVLQIAQDPGSGLMDVVRVVGKDPALSARLLKAASTAAYATSVPATTVDRAVNKLGMNATLCVALSFSVVKSVRPGPAGGFDATQYWRRAVTTAVCTRALGAREGFTSPAELFMAGLLQDLGMLALHVVVGEEYSALCRAAGTSHEALIAAERERLGADHAAVGAWLLDRWKITGRLVRAVEFSHTAPAGAKADPDGFARVSRWGGAVAELWCGDAAVGARSCAGLASEGLTPQLLEEVVARSSTEVPAETALLELEVPPEEAADLLDRAREALLELTLSVNARARDAEQRAHLDPLTGAYNRAYLTAQLPRLVAEAGERQEPLTLLFLDVDHFKLVNDRYGHQAGDAVLVGIADTLHQALRGADVVARYGGEEFVVLLPGTGGQEGMRVAERIRKDLEKYQHRVGDQALQVTASIGLVTLTRGNYPSAEALLEAADQCVYAAKRGGRNRVQVQVVEAAGAGPAPAGWMEPPGR